jgi:hypothetical protein
MTATGPDDTAMPSLMAAPTFGSVVVAMSESSPVVDVVSGPNVGGRRPPPRTWCP